MMPTSMAEHITTLALTFFYRHLLKLLKVVTSTLPCLHSLKLALVNNEAYAFTEEERDQKNSWDEEELSQY